MNYNRHLCAPARAGSLAERWQQLGPGSAAACDKLPMSDQVPPPYSLCTREWQIHMFQRLTSKEQTLWLNVSESLNCVVIDPGHPPGTQISERAVALTIQLQPSVTGCRYFFPI